MNFLRKVALKKSHSPNWAECTAAICCFHLVTNTLRTIHTTKKGEGKRWGSGTGLISNDHYFIHINTQAFDISSFKMILSS